MTEDHDPYWEYDESDCWNCGGEGFVYGCSWDWQCDTYDEGEGTCLCTRRCNFCNPAKPDPETQQLRQILGDALASGGVTRMGGDGEVGSVAEGHSTRPDAQNPPNSLKPKAQP